MVRFPNRRLQSKRREIITMKNLFKRIIALTMTLMIVLAVAAPAFAANEDAAGADVQTEQTVENTEAASDNVIGAKGLAAGICVGLAAAGGAIGMGLTSAKSTESIARQPEAIGDVRTTMMLGLVFIETAIIYALVVAILIIFVL